MRLPSIGIDPATLPDIAHYRSHGIDRITAWCLTRFCCHQAALTFEELAAHGAGETTKLLAAPWIAKSSLSLPVSMPALSMLGPVLN